MRFCSASQSDYDPLVIAVDPFGKAPKSFNTHGHSMNIDPWGELLAQLADGPVIVTAEIDLDHLAKVRAELSALKHKILI